MTQWFCWSLSLLNGYFIGGLDPIFRHPHIERVRRNRILSQRRGLTWRVLSFRKFTSDHFGWWSLRSNEVNICRRQQICCCSHRSDVSGSKARPVQLCPKDCFRVPAKDSTLERGWSTSEHWRNLPSFWQTRNLEDAFTSFKLGNCSLSFPTRLTLVAELPSMLKASHPFLDLIHVNSA